MWHCGHTEQRAQAQDERLHDLICERVFDSFGKGDKCARQVEEQKFQQEEERCGERGEKEESIPTWPRPSRHYLWRVRGNCNLSPPSIDDVVPDQS